MTIRTRNREPPYHLIASLEFRVPLVGTKNDSSSCFSEILTDHGACGTCLCIQTSITFL